MKELRIIKESIDLEGVGQVNVTWDFDNDEYQEWLEDCGYDNNDESFKEYIQDNVTFELEYLDNDTYHHMSFDSASFDELDDVLPDDMVREMIQELLNGEEYRFETNDLYNRETFNVDNPEELNNIAMKVLNHGEYYKGCRGFILTNGVIVYTPAEHNLVSQINGINNTFDFIRKGNIRILNQSIDLAKEPTNEQKNTLRSVISSYADEELYMDILSNEGEIGVHYTKPDYRRVIADIDRYFNEGIKPMPNNLHESIDKNGRKINIIGYADDLEVSVDGKVVAHYSFKDSSAYPFIINKGKLYIGESQTSHNLLMMRAGKEDDSTIFGRIWVKAKSNDFNYALVAFWGSIEGHENYKQKIYELADKLRVNPGKIVIATERNGCSFDITPLDEWNGLIHQRTDRESEANMLHLMSPEDKKDNTSGFRKVRDKKLSDKLRSEKGNEMPMAKYHNIIYQESKNSKDIIISEEQFKKIFNNNKKEVIIKESQYNTLFTESK